MTDHIARFDNAEPDIGGPDNDGPDIAGPDNGGPNCRLLLHCWTHYYQDNLYMLYVSRLQVFKRYSLPKFTLLYLLTYLLTFRHSGAIAFSFTEHL